MPSNNWNVWWQATSGQSPDEKEEFIRGIFGETKPVSKKDVLFAIVAGYVGGRIARRTGRD